MRHLAAMLAFALAFAAPPALAQGDPMEAQRCVWRCLSMSRGPSDPAYNACVRAECERSSSGKARSSGRAAPPPPPVAASHWRPARGTRYPAVAECLHENFCLLVSCPARGQLSLELYAMENGWVPGLPVQMRTGGFSLGLTLPARVPGTDLYRWPMTVLMLEALKSGSEVQMDIDRNLFRVTLAGSGSAIAGIEDRCR